jgi:hypothetical protein
MRLQVSFKHDSILPDILAPVPALEHLTIDQHGLLSAAFFERLTYVPGAAAPPLCPRLRTFDGGYQETCKLESAPALVDMVASRWHVATEGAPVARLHAILINCDDAQCAAQLAEYAAEGLAVTLNSKRIQPNNWTS